MVAPVCFHLGAIEVNANVVKLEDRKPPVFMLEIRAACSACGVSFRFDGVPIGVSTRTAALSVDQLELTIPMLAGES